MELLPLFERLGVPLAFAVYFLLETRRVMKNVDKLQVDQLKYAREDADMYRHLVMKVVTVVEKTNTIIASVKPLLEENAQREDTRIIRALEPTEVVTPDPQSRECTEDERAQLEAFKAKIIERNRRVQNHG